MLKLSKKATISIVLVSVVLGLILPIQPVHAFWGLEWWEAALGPVGIIVHAFRVGPGKTATDLFNALIFAIFGVLNAITLVFVYACSALLNWVMSENFINVSFTQNDFVIAGWTIIRNLTNIAIVLGLVVVALATILRISTYHAKKTLPLLLIVALLVNFSPVICGLIIDASNIVMRYFLEVGGLDTGFIKLFSDRMGLLYDTARGEDAVKTLALGIVLVGFNIFAGLIFLLYAFLFLFRYVALWMLVILSPLAFFCYVFPYTRTWWQKWWQQFLAWCIVGIPAAFSIFLANEMIGLIAAKRLIGEVPGGALTPFALLMGYIVPLAFLYVGFLMAMQTGAAGANIAIKGFQWTKGGIWAGTKWAGKKLARKPLEKAGKGLGKAGEKVGGAGKGWVRGRKTWWGKTGAALVSPFGYAMRGVGYGVALGGAKLEAQATEAYRRDVEKAKAKAKGATLETQRAMLMSPFPSVRAGALQAAIGDKNIKDLRETMGLKNEEIAKILRQTLRTLPSLFKDLKDSFPGLAAKIAAAERVSLNEPLARQAGVFMDKEDIEKFETLADKIRATIKPSKIENWTDEEMEASLRSRMFHRRMTPSHISQLAKTFGGKFFAEWKEQVGGREWYAAKNPPAEKYIASSAGQGLGVSFGPEETKEPGTPAEEEERIRRRGERRGRKIPETGEEGVKKRKEPDVGER